MNNLASKCRSANTHVTQDAFVLQDACQDRHARAGFTLMEVMVVVTIIGILAAMMTSVVTSGRRQARQTDCKSNLRQMGIAILVYRGEHNGANPPWLSALYPEYVDDRRGFVCRSDKKRGVGPIRPDDPDQFTEVIDNDFASRKDQQNTDVMANSYFYEFSIENCGWPATDYNGDGIISWWEFKEDQLRYGDDANGGTRDAPVPYSQSKLPIVRCYHHHGEGRIQAYAKSGNFKASTLSAQPITINIAYAGNVYVGPLWWEGMPDPGEK